MSAPAPMGDALIGSVIAGKYRIVALIAKGGMGRVYRAEQLPLGRPVALKFLLPGATDPLAEKRFLQEAATYARLTHPNTVTVYDYGSIELDGEDCWYIALEYVQGRTLSQAMRADGPFPPARVVGIGREICRSLREAHSLGIVHRDLKPGNVMLIERDAGESVKVLDFGVAKIAHEGAEGLTQVGSFVGTPKYSSPEQIEQHPVDARADIYAVGVLLYEMLAGQPPFSGEPVRVLFAHLHLPPPPIRQATGRDVPPELEAVVMKCLAKKPADRYPDAGSLMRELAAAVPTWTGEDTEDRSHSGRRVVPGAPTDASEPSLIVEALPPRRSLMAYVVAGWVALSLVFVLAVGVVGAWWWTSHHAPESPGPAEVGPIYVLNLESEPSGAEVYAGDRSLGKTPVSIPFDEGTAPHTYVLKLPGYRDATHVQGALGHPARTERVVLEPLAASTTTTPTPPSTPPNAATGSGPAKPADRPTKRPATTRPASRPATPSTTPPPDDLRLQR